MIQKLRELRDANPFQPFVVALADGRRFNIPSPDMIWLPGNGRGGLHVFGPETDRIVSVNVMLMSLIEWDSGSIAKGSQE